MQKQNSNSSNCKTNAKCGCKATNNTTNSVAKNKACGNNATTKSSRNPQDCNQRGAPAGKLKATNP